MTSWTTIKPGLEWWEDRPEFGTGGIFKIQPHERIQNDPIVDEAKADLTANKMKLRFSWACAHFRASKEDPSFCGNCGDFASMHKGPTPGAMRCFCPACTPAPAKKRNVSDNKSAKSKQA